MCLAKIIFSRYRTLIVMMNKFQIKSFGPYSFGNFLLAPDIYIVSILIGFVATLLIVPEINEFAESVKKISHRESVVKTFLISAVNLSGRVKLWGIVFIFLTSVFLPIRGILVGPLLLCCCVVFYSINIDSLVDINSSNSDVVWIVSCMNFLYIGVWLKFRWWYWSVRGE